METNNGFITTVDGEVEVTGPLSRGHVDLFRILEGFRRTIQGFWYIYDHGAGVVRCELRRMDALAAVEIRIDDLATELPIMLWSATRELFNPPPGENWLARAARLVLMARRAELIANNAKITVTLDVMTVLRNQPYTRVTVLSSGEFGISTSLYPERDGISDICAHIEGRTIQQVRSNMHFFARTERLPSEIREALTDGP